MGENGNGANQQSSYRHLEPEIFRKLFIGGLSLNTTDESLKAFYSQYGELLDCVVMRDGQTKKSRGFGFVSFATKEEVDKAMEARPHEIDGKVVDPKRAVPRDHSSRPDSNVSTKRLYVSGVREEHNEELFLNYFSTFGSVTKVEVITDKATEKPRGFAFVTFDDHDPVDKCVLQKSHMINGFRCDVKKALSKDDMNRASQQDKDRMERGQRSRGNQRAGPPYGGGRNNGGGYRDNGGYGNWGPPQHQGWGGPPAWGGGGYGGGYGNGGGYGGSYGPSGGYGGGPPQGWNPAGPATQQGAWAQGAGSGSGNWGAGGGWSADANQAGWGSAAGGSQAPPSTAQQWGGPSGPNQWQQGGQPPAAGVGGSQRF